MQSNFMLTVSLSPYPLTYFEDLLSKLFALFCLPSLHTPLAVLPLLSYRISCKSNI